MNYNNIAVIVAAGTGSRSGLNIPKQYFQYKNQTILEHTINCFLSHKDIDAIQVIINSDHSDLYHKSISEIKNNKKILPVIIGGNTRQESVLNGLKAIENHNPENVFIHDAARPFLTDNIIDHLLLKLKHHDGAAPALAVTDSLRYVNDGIFSSSISRDNLLSVQTPQAFHFNKIFNAHKNASIDHTDDISVGLSQGLKITYIQGCKNNIKMTTPQDFTEMMQKENSYIPDIRTGSGYDVHRLISGKSVILGGIEIPCEYALKGHSDADVLLHAITDAVLGSASEHDIGHHFPPTEQKWKNVASSVFLKHAIGLLEQKKMAS